MNNKLRILLADDHKLVREGLKLLINKQTDMSVVDEAGHGLEAVQKARQLKPDLILMDLSMPGMNGLQAMQILKAEGSTAKILVLTTHEDPSYFRQVCRAGAAGYVVKRMAGDELVKCIRKVAAGEVHFDGALAGQALTSSLREPEADPEFRALSKREEQVMLGIAWGYTNKELADKLGVSVKTVETHKVHLCDKLGLCSRVDIVRYAVRQGLLAEARDFGQVEHRDQPQPNPPR